MPAPAAPSKPLVQAPPIAAMPTRRRLSASSISIGLLLAAAVGGGILYYFEYFQLGAGTGAAATAPPVVAQGTVQVISRPDGAKVFVDGVERGVAPLNLTLPVGEYRLELDSGTAKRTVPLAIEAGTVVKQYVDLGVASEAAGRLEISSEPAGAQVTLDGSARGTTPLVLADIPPGLHTIVIGTGETSVTRTVQVSAGATAAVVASIAPVTGAAGWVTVKSAVPTEILEGGRVVAAAGVDRVMLPTGRHELEVVSAEYEFRTTVTVQVQAGKTVTANIALPNGSLSINAVPWAEVWLDGKAMGTTPLGNLSVTVGPHEILWKHPEFGERRQTVKVLARSPVRAGMDFGK